MLRFSTSEVEVEPNSFASTPLAPAEARDGQRGPGDLLLYLLAARLRTRVVDI